MLWHSSVIWIRLIERCCKDRSNHTPASNCTTDHHSVTWTVYLCCSFTSFVSLLFDNEWINQHKNSCPFCMFSSWAKPQKWFILLRNKKKNQLFSLNQETSCSSWWNGLCFEVGHSCSGAELWWPWSNQGFNNCRRTLFLFETAAMPPIRGSGVTRKRIHQVLLGKQKSHDFGPSE